MSRLFVVLNIADGHDVVSYEKSTIVALNLDPFYCRLFSILSFSLAHFAALAHSHIGANSRPSPNYQPSDVNI